MSTAFLCVQFRNLLPSEQLLLFARALWNDLHQRGVARGVGDATLSITQTSSEVTCFEAELSTSNVRRRCRAREADALTAIERVFTDWSAGRTPTHKANRDRCETDTRLGTAWHSDPAPR